MGYACCKQWSGGWCGQGGVSQQRAESRRRGRRGHRRARAGPAAPRHTCIFRTPFNAHLASTDGNNALIPVIKSVLEFGLFTCFYFSSMIILNPALWPIRSRETGSRRRTVSILQLHLFMFTIYRKKENHGLHLKIRSYTSGNIHVFQWYPSIVNSSSSGVNCVLIVSTKGIRSITACIIT